MICVTLPNTWSRKAQTCRFVTMLEKHHLSLLLRSVILLLLLLYLWLNLLHFLFIEKKFKRRQSCSFASTPWFKSIGGWNQCSQASRNENKTRNRVVFGKSKSISFKSFCIDYIIDWIGFAWFACSDRHNHFRIFGFNQWSDIVWRIFGTKELGYCIID